MDMDGFARLANDMRCAKAKAEALALNIDRLRNGPNSLERSDTVKAIGADFRALASYLGYKVEAAE